MNRPTQSITKERLRQYALSHMKANTLTWQKAEEKTRQSILELEAQGLLKRRTLERWIILGKFDEAVLREIENTYLTASPGCSQRGFTGIYTDYYDEEHLHPRVLMEMYGGIICGREIFWRRNGEILSERDLSNKHPKEYAAFLAHKERIGQLTGIPYEEITTYENPRTDHPTA